MFSLLHFLSLLLRGDKLALITGPLAMMAGPGSGDGFQTFVNNPLPKGVPGDFAGANIRANVVAGAFAYYATPAGVQVGVGAWFNPATKQASNYYQGSAFKGFVHREGQTVITTFLGIASMGILSGEAVTGMAEGDFWGLFNAGATAAQKVYFDALTGALTSAATGGTVVGSNATGSITSSVYTSTDADQTGSAIAVNQVITGAGIPAGTYIASAAGTGSGTHLWNLANADGTAIANVTSEAIANHGAQESQYTVAENVTADTTFTASIAIPVAPSEYSIMTVTAIGSGSIVPGQWLSATGGGGLAGSLNVQVLEQLTAVSPAGGGGTGTYLVTVSPVVTSTNTFVATQGKIGRISSWLN